MDDDICMCRTEVFDKCAKEYSEKSANVENQKCAKNKISLSIIVLACILLLPIFKGGGGGGGGRPIITLILNPPR